MKIWLMDCENSSRMGLIMLSRLETMAATAMIQMPSMVMTTGKSPKSYRCSPIIHATKVPTPTPIRQEFNTSTKDSQTKILTMRLFWQPRVSRMPISVLWFTMLVQEVVTSEKKLMIRTSTSRMFRMFFSRFSILLKVCFSSEQSHTLFTFFVAITDLSFVVSSFVLPGSFTLTLIFCRGRSSYVLRPLSAAQVSNDTPISCRMKSNLLQESPVRCEKMVLQLSFILAALFSLNTLMRNYRLSESTRLNFRAANSLRVQVMQPSGVYRNSQGSQGSQAWVLTIGSRQLGSILAKLGDTPYRRMPVKNILALSEYWILSTPASHLSQLVSSDVWQAQSSTSSLKSVLKIWSQKGRWMVPAPASISMQVPCCFNISSEIVCIWMEMPTDTKIMKATDSEYSSEDLLFLSLCADMFLRVRMKSVLSTQNRVTQAMSFSIRYCTLQDSRMRPSSSPIRMAKNTNSSSPMSWLMRPFGSRQQIIRPNMLEIRPKMSLPRGNSAPQMQTSVWIAYVLFLMGLRFSTRSFLRIDQIGDSEEKIGTRMPINIPPRMASKVGDTSQEYPKKVLNIPDTIFRVKQAKGKAMKLDSTTYLKEENKRLKMTKKRLAPMVLMRAKSKALRSVPISIMLFIIRTLSTNRLVMISFKMTPMNIPKQLIQIRLLAMGISDSTAKRPTFSMICAPKVLRVSQVFWQSGSEYTLIRSGMLMVICLEK